MEQQKKKPKTKYMCDQCGKILQQKQHLRRHIKYIHVEGTKLKCPICPRQLSRNDSLKRHLMRHEQEARTAKLNTSMHYGGLSEMFDTENEDWIPTVNLGRIPKKQGKSKDKKRKTLHKFWVNSNDAVIQEKKQVLVGSMMVSRVIFDESSDSLTLSQYKNLLTFTMSVDEHGDCDIVPKIDDNENTHLELVLIPKAYLNDSGFLQTRKSVSNSDITVKVEQENPKHKESAHEGFSNMTGHSEIVPESIESFSGFRQARKNVSDFDNKVTIEQEYPKYGEFDFEESKNITSESEIMPESMEKYVPIHSSIGEPIPNLAEENSDYVPHERLSTNPARYSNDCSEPNIKPVQLSCNNTCVPEPVDSSFQTYISNRIYIKKEVDVENDEIEEVLMNQLQSNSNTFNASEGPKDYKFEHIPSILQRNTSIDTL